MGESIAQQQNNPMHLLNPNEGKTQVNWGGCVIFNKFIRYCVVELDEMKVIS